MAAALRGLIVALLLAGCERSPPGEEPATGGNPKQGRQLIQHFGCGSCHKISGVPGASQMGVRGTAEDGDRAVQHIGVSRAPEDEGERRAPGSRRSNRVSIQ